MSETQGRDLKPSVDGIFYETFGFGTFFRYHNFQNEIDAWESTVKWVKNNVFGDSMTILLRDDKDFFVHHFCRTAMYFYWLPQEKPVGTRPLRQLGGISHLGLQAIKTRKNKLCNDNNWKPVLLWKLFSLVLCGLEGFDEDYRPGNFAWTTWAVSATFWAACLPRDRANSNILKHDRKHDCLGGVWQKNTL